MNIHEPVILVPPQPIDEETRQKAAALFRKLKRSPKLGSKQIAQKQAEWESIYAGVSQAVQLGGQLRVPTGNRGGINHGLRRRVLDAADDVGVLEALPRVNANVRKRYVPGKNWK